MMVKECLLGRHVSRARRPVLTAKSLLPPLCLQWFAWSSDGLQGNCVDAALSAKCRLAGEARAAVPFWAA